MSFPSSMMLSVLRAVAHTEYIVHLEHAQQCYFKTMTDVQPQQDLTLQKPQQPCHTADPFVQAGKVSPRKINSPNP